MVHIVGVAIIAEVKKLTKLWLIHDQINQPVTNNSPMLLIKDFQNL
jgi:hypothetical protein